MLYIVTNKTSYTLRFYANRSDEDTELYIFTVDGDLEEALYTACAEWCEGFVKVVAYDPDGHPVCEMYDDGGIRLLTSNLWAELD